jgi:hypothetical protein
VERYLNEDRGPRSNEEWLRHISDTAQQWLSELGAEGIEIIPWEQKAFTDDRPETPEAENDDAQDRVRPFGVGAVAPAASNDTDEGRARNRRVELVKQ